MGELAIFWRKKVFTSVDDQRFRGVQSSGIHACLRHLPVTSLLHCTILCIVYSCSFWRTKELEAGALKVPNQQPANISFFCMKMIFNNILEWRLFQVFSTYSVCIEIFPTFSHRMSNMPAYNNIGIPRSHGFWQNFHLL